MKTIDLRQLGTHDLFAIYARETAVYENGNAHARLSRLASGELVKAMLGSHFLDVIERELLAAAQEGHRCILIGLNPTLVEMVLFAQGVLGGASARRDATEVQAVHELDYLSEDPRVNAALDRLLEIAQSDSETRIAAIGETHLRRLLYLVLNRLRNGASSIRVVLGEDCRIALAMYKVFADVRG
jgi:hypothetical protein